MDANSELPAPVDLRTERRHSPLGLDKRLPLLAWKLAATGRGGTHSSAQASYHVRVVADADPTDPEVPAVWDSGVVASADSVDVSYAGQALRSRTRYVWAVRVTDTEGRQSAWSEPAVFETAFLDSADWNDTIVAAWIGGHDEPGREAAVNLDMAKPYKYVERIRVPESSTSGGGQRFRVTFDLPDDRTPVSVKLATDACGVDVQASVNGTDVSDAGLTGESVGQVLRSGENVLEVQIGAGKDVALAARLEVDFGDDEPVIVVSDGSWQVVGDDGATGETLAESLGLQGRTDHGRAPASYRPSPLLRTGFEVSSPVRRARLYATALGLYEACINGQPVSNDKLAPGWTDYHARVPYQTYDVTDLIVEGSNAIGAVLADGWYAGSLCWWGTFFYGDRRAFKARLEIEHTDGSRTVVASGGGWKSGHGEISYADLQNGVVVDAREAVDGWDTAEFDDSGWAQVMVDTPESVGELQAQRAPSIRVLHELPAVNVEKRGEGSFMVDFGQNLVGWIRLDVRGDAGTRLLVRHAEILDHKGELYLDALRGARACDEYILAGAPDGEVFEPAFTVHGFRFAEIVNYPGELTAGDITAKVVYADMEQIGEFSCSDPNLTKLQENIVWGQRGNFLSVPTDCPQRDERLGWTGDAQVFASTAAFNYDVRTFFDKWLQDLRDGQFDDGGVPHVAPDVMSGKRQNAGGAAGWADAIAVVPIELFLAYGDQRAVSESYTAIVKWLEYLDANSTEYIRPDDGFVDWLAITPTPKPLVSTAFYAFAAKLAAEAAEILGKPDEQRKWSELYAAVRAAFRSEFVRGGGRMVSGTQTSYVLALHFGLLTKEEEPRAAAHLVEELAARNWHLSTGFLGTPYLLSVLSTHGHEEAAFKLLMQDTFPSWLYPVVYGDATTIWERWDSWSDSRGFQDPRMTSFNHYAYGAVGAWIYANLGGLSAAEPGYKKLLVRPRPGGGVTWAKTALETPYGRAAVDWRTSDGGGLELDVTVPPNTTAEVWLPGAAKAEEVGAGTHSFQA
jgi:alpha-L-rhamnosidase